MRERFSRQHRRIMGRITGRMVACLLVVLVVGGAAAEESFDTVTESLFVLGESYEAGEWVRQSDLLAYMWYLLATAAGHDAADVVRHRMTSRLSPAEIAAVQALARQCHATGYWLCGEATAADDLATTVGAGPESH